MLSRTCAWNVIMLNIILSRIKSLIQKLFVCIFGAWVRLTGYFPSLEPENHSQDITAFSVPEVHSREISTLTFFFSFWTIVSIFDKRSFISSTNFTFVSSENVSTALRSVDFFTMLVFIYNTEWTASYLVSFTYKLYISVLVFVTPFQIICLYLFQRFG